MFYQVLATYYKATESALQIQQELLRQWAHQWSLATSAALGNGRAGQAPAPRERPAGSGTGVMKQYREALDAPSRAGVRMIEDAARCAEAAASPRRHGDGEGEGEGEGHTAAPRGTTAAPVRAPAEVAPAAPAPRTGEGARIRLHAEELHVHTRFVETGEVRVRKEVVTEHRTLDVPVRREEIVIERYAPAGAHGDALDLKPGEELRIPVREEQVTVEKRPVVTEEVTVGKRLIEATEHVGGEVRKEEVRIDQEGEVDLRTPDDAARPA